MYFNMQGRKACCFPKGTCNCVDSAGSGTIITWWIDCNKCCSCINQRHIYIYTPRQELHVESPFPDRLRWACCCTFYTWTNTSIPPKWRSRRPAKPARAPHRNINNVDIGWNVFNTLQLQYTFNPEFLFISIDFNLEFQFISTYFNISFQRIPTISSHFFLAKIHWKEMKYILISTNFKPVISKYFDHIYFQQFSIYFLNVF